MKSDPLRILFFATAGFGSFFFKVKMPSSSDKNVAVAVSTPASSVAAVFVLFSSVVLYSSLVSIFKDAEWLAWKIQNIGA